MVTAVIGVIALAASFVVAHAGTILLVGKLVFTLADALTNKNKNALGDGGAGSPTYSFGRLQTQVSNLLVRPIIYGNVKQAGNKIWQNEQNTSTIKQLVLFCDEEIHGFSNIKFNNIDYTRLIGCSVTKYYGDGEQAIDSRVPGSTDAERAAIVGGLKYDAYLAITAKASKDIPNSGFNVTAEVLGRKILNYDYVQDPDYEYSEEDIGNVLADVTPFSDLDFEIIEPEALNELGYVANDGSYFYVIQGLQIHKYICDNPGVLSTGVLSETINLGADVLLIISMFVRPDTGTVFALLRKLSDPTPRIYDLSNSANFSPNTQIFAGSICVSPDGLTVITGNGGRGIREWRMTSPWNLTSLYEIGTSRHDISSTLYGLAFSPDGTKLHYIGYNPAWPSGTRARIIQIKLPAPYVLDGDETIEGYYALDDTTLDPRGLSWFNDGHYFAVGGEDTRKVHHFVTDSKLNIDLSKVDYNNNPAWCIYDFLTAYNGIGLNASDLDTNSFLEAANYCDVIVDGQVRFSLNLVLDTKKSRLDWIKVMCLICRGYIVYIDGKIHLKIDKAGDSNQLFDSSNIITGSESFWTTPRENKYDIVKVQFVDPENEWTRVYAIAELEEYNNEQPIIKEIEAFGITNFKQASRLAWFYLNDASTTNKFMSFKTTKEGLDRIIGDIIDITSETFGITAKKFRITGLSENDDGSIDVVCKEYNENLYNDTMGSVEPVYTAVTETDLTFGNVVTGSGSFTDTIESSVVGSSAYSVTEVIPYDSTTPLITEGKEIITSVYEPENYQAKISINVVIPSLYADTTDTVILALFKDNECIASSALNIALAGSGNGYNMALSTTINTADNDTFVLSARVGVATSGTNLTLSGTMGDNTIPYMIVKEETYIYKPYYYFLEDLGGKYLTEAGELIEIEQEEL